MNRILLSNGSRALRIGRWVFLLALVSPTVGLAQGVEGYVKALEDKRAAVRLGALESKEIASCFTSHDDEETCELSTEDYHRLTEVFLGLLTDPEPKIRVKAIYYLNSTTDSRFTQPIARLLRDPSDYVRAAAAESFSLTILDDDAIVRELEHLLGDKSKNVRRQAAGSLGMSGTKRSLALLREEYKHETDQGNRMFFSEMVEELEKRVGKKSDR